MPLVSGTIFYDSYYDNPTRLPPRSTAQLSVLWGEPTAAVFIPTGLPATALGFDQQTQTLRRPAPLLQRLGDANNRIFPAIEDVVVLPVTGQGSGQLNPQAPGMGPVRARPFMPTVEVYLMFPDVPCLTPEWIQVQIPGRWPRPAAGLHTDAPLWTQFVSWQGQDVQVPRRAPRPTSNPEQSFQMPMTVGDLLAMFWEQPASMPRTPTPVIRPVDQMHAAPPAFFVGVPVWPQYPMPEIPVRLRRPVATGDVAFSGWYTTLQVEQWPQRHQDITPRQPAPRAQPGGTDLPPSVKTDSSWEVSWADQPQPRPRPRPVLQTITVDPWQLMENIPVGGPYIVWVGTMFQAGAVAGICQSE